MKKAGPRAGDMEETEMEGFWIFVIVVLVLFVLDMAATAAYCIWSKKKSKVKNLAKNQAAPVDDEPVVLQGSVLLETDVPEVAVPAKLSMKSRVRAYIEGLILYQCNTLQYLPSQTLRKLILKFIYQMNLSMKAIVYHGCEFREPWNITIDEGASIGDHCVLDGRNGLHIEHDVNIGSRVFIWTEQHDYNDPYFRCNNKGGAVIIKERAWLSAGTIVLPKVTVGKGAVLAAGAVATKDLYDYTVYGGIPAKRIAIRSMNLNYSLKDTYLHFY